jgi:hypothetical protein
MIRRSIAAAPLWLPSGPGATSHEAAGLILHFQSFISPKQQANPQSPGEIEAKQGRMHGASKRLYNPPQTRHRLTLTMKPAQSFFPPAFQNHLIASQIHKPHFFMRFPFPPMVVQLFAMGSRGGLCH